MLKHNLNRGVTAIAAAAALAGCSSAAGAPPAATQANLQANSLQFRVGYATLPGGTGMNVLATFRQGNGGSAVLVNQPVLTGPFTLPAATAAADTTSGATFKTGPSATEVAGTASGCPSAPCITGSPQQIPGTPALNLPKTTFGEAGGIYSTGFGPFNYTASGNPYGYAAAGGGGAYTPYPFPMYAAGTGNTPIVATGGPPAYDPSGIGKGTRTGNFGSNILGVDMGLSVFGGTTPSAGTYTLSAIIPTTGAGTTLTATTTLGASAPLPAAAAPVPTFVGDGSVTIAYTLPARVTGAFIQAVDPAQCGGGTAYYTFWVTSSGTVTITNASAPQGSTQAVCTAAANGGTGDTLRVVLVGFDYNHYSLTDNAGLSATYPQTPGLPGTADVTISPVATSTSV